MNMQSSPLIWQRNFVIGLITIMISMPVSASELPGTTYLSNNHDINAMVCNERYLWAAITNEGLLRIDKIGNAATIYTSGNSALPNDTVRAIAMTKSGELVVGTRQGAIGRFDGTAWTSIMNLPSSDIVGLEVDTSGALWVSSQSKGLLRISEGSVLEIGDRTSSIFAKNPAGNLWIYKRSSNNDCASVSLYEYVNNSLQPSISLTPICQHIGNSSNFIIDNNRNCWISVVDTLIRLNAKTVKKYPLGNDSSLSKWVSLLSVNNKNILLIVIVNGTGKQEVFLYDTQNEQQHPFGSALYVTTDIKERFLSACADDQGEFWLSTIDGAIYKLDSQGAIKRITPEKTAIPGNFVTALLEDVKGNVWVATTKGIAQYTGTEWISYPGTNDTLSGADVTSLALDSAGTIWAGFSQPIYMSSVQCGLSYYKNNHWKRLYVDHFSIFNIAVKNDGTVWTAEEGGVFKYEGSTRTRLFESIGSSDIRTSESTRVTSIAFDTSGIPWIGTGLGIKKLLNDQWVDDTVISRIFPATLGSTFPGGVTINTICLPRDGSAWIGTANGLLRYVNGNVERIDTTLFPEKSVISIAATSSNSAWIGTGRGLVYYDGKQTTTYTNKNSALQNNTVTALTITKKGDLWVGTHHGGVTVFNNPHALATARLAIPVIKRQPLFSVVQAHGRVSTFRINLSCLPVNNMTLRIISLDGKNIRSFNGLSSGRNTTSLLWDGTDDNKRFVPRGMYIAALTSNNRTYGTAMVRVY